MGAILHPGGYRGQIGDTVSILYAPDAGVAVPTVEAVEGVNADNGLWLQRFNIPEPTAGYVWYYGLPSQRKRPCDPGDEVELELGAIGIALEGCEFFLRRTTPRNFSNKVLIPLSYPEATPGSRPDVIGEIDAASFDVGESATVDCSDAFSGTSIVYSARFDDGVLTAGWSINPSTGVLTVPTTAALSKNVIVRASNEFGRVDASAFAVTVAATALTLITPAVFSGSSPAVGVTWSVSAPVLSGDGDSYTITYRVLRSGVAIAAFSPATTYVVAAADQGNTLTVEYQVVGATETVVYTATGSAVIPASPVTNPSVVGTIANVSVTPGATITRTAAGVFSGTGTPTYTMRLATGPLTAGYAINASTGAITLPNTANIAVITVFVGATYPGFGPIETSFTHQVAPALTVTSAVFTPNVAPGTGVGSIWTNTGRVITNGTAPFVTNYRVRRNGTPTTAFAPAAAYAIAMADQGSTVTSEVRVTDASTPVQTATMVATGSAVIPAAPVGNADFTVNTTAELNTAMVTAAARTAPQLIIMNPGNYTKWTRGALVKQGFTTVGGNRVNTNNRITIRALNPSVGAGAKTIFVTSGGADMELTGVSGVTFDGIIWRNTDKDGVNYGAGDPRNSKVGGMAGYPATNARSTQMNNCDNITFINCIFQGAHRSSACTNGCDRITITKCDVVDFGLDGFSFFGADHSNILLSYNNLRTDVDVIRSSSDNPNRHPDSLSVQGARGSDLSWIGNTIMLQPGYAQGIFCPNAPVRDGADWTTNRQQRVTIRLNTITAGHTNALVVGPSSDVICSENVIRRRLVGANEVAGPNYGVPNLNISGDVRGVFERNVTWNAIQFRNGATQANKTFTANVVSQVAWPAAMNGGPMPCGPYAPDP